MIARAVAAIFIGASLMAVPVRPAEAQGVRGTATTSVRYIELRPIEQRTVPRSAVTELPDGTFEFEGVPVFCIGELPCTYFVSVEKESTVAATQDVALTAWGLGVQGLSMTTLLRARAGGGDFDWPRSDDAFDAILAYAELNRGMFRGRVGRQRTNSGLGFSGFDGASVMATPLEWLEVEGYAGRSLARGIAEPRHEALEGIESFVIDRNAYLFGGYARVEPVTGTSFGLRYQREIWASRSGLLSERASADFSTSQFRRLMIDGAADYDFAMGRIGKAHASVRAPLLWNNITVEATARRYLPYFELWTIWGFFSPVAYHEAETRATWLASPRATVWAGAAYRKYEEANATVILRPITDDGIRLSVGGRFSLMQDLQLSGSYRTERGFGAFISSGEASLEWRPTDRLSISLDGSAFQQIEEFRLGDATLWGGGASADLRIGSRFLLSAGAATYRQNYDNRPGTADWNQVRAWSMLRTSIGRDPAAFRGTDNRSGAGSVGGAP